MRWRVIIALVVLIGLTAFAPVPFPKAKKKSGPGGLQGTWVVERRENGSGKALPKMDYKMLVRIEGDKWSFLRIVDGKKSNGPTYTVVLDKSNPTWLDLKVTVTTGKM